MVTFNIDKAFVVYSILFIIGDFAIEALDKKALRSSGRQSCW